MTLAVWIRREAKQGTRGGLLSPQIPRPNKQASKRQQAQQEVYSSSLLIENRSALLDATMTSHLL